MRNVLPLKFISHLLLMAMFILTVHGVHESAHALQGCVSESGDSAITHKDFSAPHEHPCAPPAEHKDYDGCDTCMNCACHASLAVPQLELNYNPIVVSLRFSDPYQYLPEVFLSKFIPPQILA